MNDIMLEFVTGGLGDVHVCILISKIIILYFFLYFFSWTQNEIKMLVLKNKKCCAVSNTAYEVVPDWEPL